MNKERAGLATALLSKGRILGEAIMRKIRKVYLYHGVTMKMILSQDLSWE